MRVVKYVTRAAFRPVTVSSKSARFPPWGLLWSYCCWCLSAAPSWQPERPCPWTRSRTGMTRGCLPTEEGAAMVAGDTAVAVDAGKASPEGWLREISYYYWWLILIGVNISHFYLFQCLTNEYYFRKQSQGCAKCVFLNIWFKSWSHCINQNSVTPICIPYPNTAFYLFTVL